jgi:anti-anti-sigma factor
MKKKILGLIGALEIELRGTEDIALLELSGQMDAYTSEEVTKIIDTHINNGNLKIVVDLTKVDYMDSSGLCALINAKIRLAKRNGNLKLVGLGGKVRQIFEIAGLINMFDVYDSHEKAFENF